MELVGRSVIGGREAWELKVTPKGGTERRFYLDAQSYLLLQIESTRQVAGRAIEIETAFTDYRETGGLVFARSIEIGVKGRPRRISVVVEKIEIDPVLDDARFRMPEGTASTRFLTSPVLPGELRGGLGFAWAAAFPALLQR